jgi:hypothetical protein
MASPRTDPPARKSGGFSFANPGTKEYLTAAGVALGLALLYFWYKKNHPSKAASTATPADTSAGPATPTGLNTGQLLAWIHDHQSSTTTTPPPPKPKPDPEDKDVKPKPKPRRRPTPDPEERTSK